MAPLPSLSSEDRPRVEQRVRKMVKRWPTLRGYHLNPDEAVVEGIVQGLVRSAMSHGANYCP